jgi:hypothetical protein
MTTEHEDIEENNSLQNGKILVPHIFVKKHLADRHLIDSLYKEIFNQIMRSEQCWTNVVLTKCF